MKTRQFTAPAFRTVLPAPFRSKFTVMSDQERAQERARKRAAKAEKPQWALTDKLFEYYLAKVDNLERGTRRMTDDELREYFSDNSGLTSKQIEIVITRLNNL